MGSVVTSTWDSDDAHPGKDSDDITKYDHLLPIGGSRVSAFDEQLRIRDSRIAQLEVEIDRLGRESTTTPWHWLNSTYTLQREVYGHELPIPENTDRLADYAQVNLFAAVDEIMEMAGEVGWKPWASPRGWIRREHVKKEAVDVLHFIANVLCAAGISDDEFWEAYRAKQEVNSRRQELGYDGVSGKCPGCKRAYDDGIDCTPGTPEGELEPNAAGDICVRHEPRCAVEK